LLGEPCSAYFPLVFGLATVDMELCAAATGDVTEVTALSVEATARMLDAFRSLPKEET
jgi:hypothetical protein